MNMKCYFCLDLLKHSQGTKFVLNSQPLEVKKLCSHAWEETLKTK